MYCIMITLPSIVEIVIHVHSACDERHPRKHGFRLFLWLTPLCGYRVTKSLWSSSKGKLTNEILHAAVMFYFWVRTMD